MSHAPVRRKSRQAVAAAMSNAASPKPAPHLVVLRVKRKRGDAAVESLLVAPDERGSSGEDQGFPDRKRRAAGGAISIEETLADLNLDKNADQPHNNNMMQPPKRLFYKRVRTTEPDGSSNDDRRMKEKRPAPSATVAHPPPPPPPPNHAAFGSDAPVPPASNGSMPSRGGGRLDALLSSRAANSLVSPPPRPAAVMDFMEVRRVKARAVGNARATSTNAGGSPGRGRREQQQQQPTTPSIGVAAAVGPGTATADFHVIDLQAVGLRDNADMDLSSGVGGTEGETFKGGAAAKRTAAPILTPVERQMDEAIFTAFQTGNMSSLRDILTTSSSPSPASVNYRRRLGDATTALMAAAFHGDLDTVRHLLSVGAKASLVDANGKSAALFAGMGGHRECFAELQRTADDEEEEQRALSKKHSGLGGGGGGPDFVYDLYYFEPSASTSPTEGEPNVMPTAWNKVDEKTPSTAGVALPVVRLSGIGPVDENAIGTTADVELEFEHESDWSELGDGDDGEDPDSNSEGYYGNDYPEDEGDEDDFARVGAAPYIYGGGSGSSCESEGGNSSSSRGDGGFDSDSDSEPYCRRVVEMPADEDHVSGNDMGAAGFVESMPPTAVGGTAVESTFHAGLGGNADVFEWGQKR